MNLFLFDLETTGIKAEENEMIELSFYNYNLDTWFESLVYSDIPNSAEDINKISSTMIKGAPSFLEIVPGLEEFITQEPCFLVAHNGDAFDVLYLKKHYKMINREFPSNWKFIDTLKISRTLMPSLKSHTLQKLCQQISPDLQVTHRSRDDVLCLKALLDTWLEQREITELYQISFNYLIPKMPFGKHKNKKFEDIPLDYIQWMINKGIFEKDFELAKAFWKKQPYFKDTIELMYPSLVEI